MGLEEGKRDGQRRRLPPCMITQQDDGSFLGLVVWLGVVFTAAAVVVVAVALVVIKEGESTQ